MKNFFAVVIFCFVFVSLKERLEIFWIDSYTAMAATTATDVKAPAVLEVVKEAAATVPLEGPVVVPPTSEEISAFLTMLGGLKGAGTLAIIMVIVQGLAILFRSSLGTIAGIYRLLVVNGLTLLLGIIALKMQGMEWAAVLLNSQTVVAIQVFLHQVFTQYKKLPLDTAVVKSVNTPETKV